MGYFGTTYWIWDAAVSQRQYLAQKQECKFLFSERTPVLQMRHQRLGDVKITQVVALVISPLHFARKASGF